MINIPQELANITFSEKYLYLNCPNCKEIPILCLNEINPEKIDINCDKCDTNFQLNLKDYLSDLSSENLLKNKNNCISHNNYFDRFCFKCHIQYCTKCEINNNKHSDHSICRMKKMINLEKIENAKNSIKTKKDYFKKYISNYIKEKLPYIEKMEKSRQNFIINNLMKLYVNSMKIFFLFCDNILLNYDLEFPDYYQQKNLINFIELLDKTSPLIDLIETKMESILIYSNNNFINKNNEIIYNLIDLSNDKISEISDALFLDDKFIVLAFNNISLKIYNYQNKNYITTIENNFGEKNIKFNEIRLSQIYKSIFSVILKSSSNLSIIKLYSININTLTVLFEKQYNTEIKYIKKINNNSLGIVFGNYLEIYSSEDNFENISQQNISKFEILNKIETLEKIEDFIITPDDLYIIIACLEKIYIYKSKDYIFFKEIKLIKNYHDDIQLIDDNKIIYSGIDIGIFTINDSSYKLLFDEKISGRWNSYLASISKDVNYSNFVLTFNKLICKRQLRIVESTSFEDDEDHITIKQALYIFDYNPNNTVKLSKKIENLKIVNIYKNYNNEIIIVQEKKVGILYI